MLFRTDNKKRIGTSLNNFRTLFLFVCNRKQAYKVKGVFTSTLPQFSFARKICLRDEKKKKKKKKIGFIFNYTENSNITL